MSNKRSTGVYGVSPYSYLTAQSPTDKEAPGTLPKPASPGWSPEPRDEDQEDEKQPYNYLNPHGPVPFQRDGSIRPKEQPNILRPGSGDGDSSAVSNPAYLDGGDAPGSGQFYPARREDSMYQSNSLQRHGAPGARENPYTKQETDYKIPRPRLGEQSIPENGTYEPRQNYDDYSQSNGRYDNQMYALGMEDPKASPKQRPPVSEERLDEHYRTKRSGGRRALCICSILLLVLFCLGAGFAAGWFARQYTGDDSGATASPTTADTPLTTTMPLVTSATTTITTTSTTIQPPSTPSAASTTMSSEPTTST